MKNITFRNLNEGLDNLYFKDLPFSDDQLEGNDWRVTNPGLKRIQFSPRDKENRREELSSCVMSSAQKVMAAYQNANKWLDIVKENVYIETSCVFFSSYIHAMAHTMPERFDKFGDILHTMNIKIPYPETQYIPKEPHDIDEVFEVIFMILDSIKGALNEFIKCTDEDYHGMACSAETLLNDIEGEYPMLYRLRDEWKQCNGDNIKFDKYVNQYVKGKDDLLESFRAHRKSFRKHLKESNTYSKSDDYRFVKEDLVDEDRLYVEDGYKLPNEDEVVNDTYNEFRNDFVFDGQYVPANFDKAVGGTGGWSPEEYPELSHPDETTFKEKAIELYVDRFCELNNLNRSELADNDINILTEFFLENASLPDSTDMSEVFWEWSLNDNDTMFGEDLAPRGFQCEYKCVDPEGRERHAYDYSVHATYEEAEAELERTKKKLAQKGCTEIQGSVVEFHESLDEDTIKCGDKWCNKGDKGVHGKFDTKKEADAQRKAMFANGFNEDNKSSCNSCSKSLDEDNQQQSFYTGPGRYEVYEFMGGKTPRFFKYADFMNENQYNKAVSLLGDNFASATKVRESFETTEDDGSLNEASLKYSGAFNKLFRGVTNLTTDKKKARAKRSEYLHGNNWFQNNKASATDDSNKSNNNSSNGSDSSSSGENVLDKVTDAASTVVQNLSDDAGEAAAYGVGRLSESLNN